MSGSSKMHRVALTQHNQAEAVTATADYIRRGYAAIIPTDTIYGLAVDATDAAAVDRFFALKRRPAERPVPVFVRDIEMAKELAYIDARQEKILNSLWPGAFTFVLEKRDSISERISAGTSTVGLRVPNHEFCQSLLAEVAVPLTASSANVSGKDAPEDLDAILAQFKEYSMVPDIIIDAGPVAGTVPSTVIDIRTPQAKILRMSATTPAMMRAILEAGVSL